MAPKLLLLLPALFFSLVLLVAPNYCIGDPTSTTLAISQATGTVCGIMAGSQNRRIQCTTFQESAELNASFPINSTISFDSISGGHNYICSLRSGGASFFCWDGIHQRIKRIYSGPTALRLLSVGEGHVAAIDGNQTKIRWWRYGCNRHASRCRQFPKLVYGEYLSLTSGDVFTCAISGDHSVHCWGPRADSIEKSFAGVKMRSLTAGGGRMCGLNMTGHLFCTGNENNVPPGEACEFTSIAIGETHTCAIRRKSKIAICWGQFGSFFPMNNTGFEFLVAGGNLTCGLTTYTFKVACWNFNGQNWLHINLSLPTILPGVCVPDEAFCSSGVYPDSGKMCGGSGVICMRPDTDTTDSWPCAIIPNEHSTSKKVREWLHKWWFIIAILGALSVISCALWRFIIAILGILSVISCAFNSFRRNMKYSPLSLFVPQPDIAMVASSNLPGPTFPVMGNVQVFNIKELKSATYNFSWALQIGARGFGTVYCGWLSNGRQVAVKCCDTTVSDSEAIFKAVVKIQSEARHTNVVSLIGYCTENNARLRVFEYMRNRDLHRKIHHPRVLRKQTRLFSSWKLRLKVLLDAARGIEYLHRYSKPTIIHGDIKSANILLNENWIAKISGFGLAVFGPHEPGHDHVYLTNNSGTVGYTDPDCNGTAPFVSQRTDVYSFGVVMLEVITGRVPYNAGNNTSLAVFAAPKIATGRLLQVLDRRLFLPAAGHKVEAVEIVALLAQQCVAPGLQRPNMSAVVEKLESAVALFDQEEAIVN